MRIDESREREEPRDDRRWQSQKSYQDSIRCTLWNLKHKYSADIGKGPHYPLITWTYPRTLPIPAWHDPRKPMEV